MRNTLILILNTLLLTTAAAAASSTLDSAAAAMARSEAQFVHRFTPKGFKTAQTESGTVTFGVLPMMRWRYATPEEKLFVFDGNRSWFYVPADKQVTITDIDDARRRDLPFLLLGDAAAREKLFRVSEKKSGPKVMISLDARDRSAAIRHVDVTVDSATRQITHIGYSDREGNRTSFDFSGYHPAGNPADFFRFSPPAGVQIIRSE